MYKLVVLLSAVALAAAKPSVIAPAVYSSIHTAPVTVAQQSSSVVYPSPAIVPAPAIYSAAALPSTAVAPVAAVAPYAALAPAPVALSAHTSALFGHDLHYLKKRSLAPHAYSSVIAPAAISHQSGFDVQPSPVVSYVAAPVVSSYAAAAPLLHSAPLAYSAPLDYSAPILSSAHAW